jgi:hypothetical protein
MWKLDNIEGKNVEIKRRGIVCARERGDFACNLGICSVLMVEIKARLHSLQGLNFRLRVTSQECSVFNM